MKLQLMMSSLLAVALLTWSGCATTNSSSTTAHDTTPIVLPASFAPMPEAVTSFGAVTADGWLYVFGGHKGERHDYSADMVSGAFHRLNLRHGRAWEKLPAAAPSQGLPLVTHDGKIYRIGGMAAGNAAGAKQDLFSTTHFQRFDPKHAQWENLTPLPAPRSSHDAVVMGDKLYVAGGWSLAGGTNKAVWPASALVLDLKNPRTGWREFPQPFQRRALALAAQGTRLYAIGGMDSDNATTLAVDIYDTVTGQWSQGPELPAGKFKGFSCSAITQGGRLYANAFQGDLLRLTTDGRAWEVVGRVEHPRLAHRLVTAGASQLIVLGGEGEEKRADLELLTPKEAVRAAR
jgi:N-acetylneuraminic acid mutarotase